MLTDERANWRPDRFAAALWGCHVEFAFLVVKLLDYTARRAELEASRNPFATVILAHLDTLATRGDAARRGQAKLALVRRLYELGHDRATIIGLFRFIDWVMRLPEDLDARFWQEIRAYEEERRMPYITSVERIGMQKGRREGLLVGLEQILPLRFGSEGLAFYEELRRADERAVLEAVMERLKTARTLAEVRAIVAAGDAS